MILLIILFQSADTFIPIAKTLAQLYDDEVDVYWLSKSLTDIVQNMQKDLPKLKEAFQSMLEKEDKDVYKYVCFTYSMALVYNFICIDLTMFSLDFLQYSLLMSSPRTLHAIF